MHRSFLLLSTLVALIVGSPSVGFSDEIKVGARAPDFSGVGVDDRTYSLDSVEGVDVVVLCFTCNGCPVAVAYEDRFIEFAKKYEGKSVKFIAINCNTKTDDLAKMKVRAKEKGFNFAYVLDPSGDAARAYGARVTPHIFVLDKKRTVAYIGSFDDNQKRPSQPFLAKAVDALLKGEKPDPSWTKAFGCGIKLKNKKN